MTDQPVRVTPADIGDPAINTDLLLVCMLDPPPPPVPIHESGILDPLGLICLAHSSDAKAWQGRAVPRDRRANIGARLREAGAAPGEWWQIADA